MRNRTRSAMAVAAVTIAAGTMASDSVTFNITVTAVRHS
jgi:hypothetical protein